ncbi:SX2_G0045200.mRNA.1.CDS.1 [Saccharomyces cerevisiae]|nr:SX2_G0045200.mRNA.1.CDS.1 [Saccharomyces cerevisiae]
MMIIIFIELCRIADSLLWIPKSSRRTSSIFCIPNIIAFIKNGIPTIISKLLKRLQFFDIGEGLYILLFSLYRKEGERVVFIKAPSKFYNIEAREKQSNEKGSSKLGFTSFL